MMGKSWSCMSTTQTQTTVVRCSSLRTLTGVERAGMEMIEEIIYLNLFVSLFCWKLCNGSSCFCWNFGMSLFSIKKTAVNEKPWENTAQVNTVLWNYDYLLLVLVYLFIHVFLWEPLECKVTIHIIFKALVKYFGHFPLTVLMCFHLFSLGCGIGYGYLHRIPTLQFSEGKKISFSGQIPNEPAPPLKDGFTEVGSHLHCLQPDENIISTTSVSGEHLLRSSHFGSQVHLSAVIPTVPVCSASTGLEQSLAGLSVSYSPTTVLTNLQTGTWSSCVNWCEVVWALVCADKVKCMWKIQKFHLDIKMLFEELNIKIAQFVVVLSTCNMRVLLNMISGAPTVPLHSQVPSSQSLPPSVNPDPTLPG